MDTSVGNPSIALIGGGISGLVCAARLSQLGLTNTTVFDTGKRAPGGRCSSRSINIDGTVHIFDHAVQFFTVSDPRFAKIISYLHSKNAVQVWPGPIVSLKQGCKPTEIDGLQAFIGTKGAQSIPECLAGLVKCKGNQWINHVSWDHVIKKWKVDDHGWFDYLVIAHNGKCADRLMASAAVPEIHNLLKVKFGPELDPRTKVMQLCSLWVLLVVFANKLHLCYEGAFVEHQDVSWIVNNTAKYKTGSHMECWTVISTKTFGAVHKVPQEFIPPTKEKEVVHLLLNGLAEVTGVDRKSMKPHFTKVQLWGAANPLNVLHGEECAFQASHNVGISGDWFVSPCVEGAALSGLALAEVINKHWKGERRDIGLRNSFTPIESKALRAFPSNKSLRFCPTQYRRRQESCVHESGNHRVSQDLGQSNQMSILNAH